MENKEKPKVSMIRLNVTTINRLKQYGKMDENYDELLNRILDGFEVFNQMSKEKG